MSGPNDARRPIADTPADDEQRARLRKLIDKARVAMFTTLDPSQQTMHSRPLQTVGVDDDLTLWFVVATRSQTTIEVQQHDGRVLLTYANTADSEYVAISGRAELVRDEDQKARRWSNIIEVWFPDGVRDPGVALLRVQPEFAEYWDGPSNKARQWLALGVAMTTGSTVAFGEHAKLQL